MNGIIYLGVYCRNINALSESTITVTAAAAATATATAATAVAATAAAVAAAACAVSTLANYKPSKEISTRNSSVMKSISSIDDYLFVEHPKQFQRGSF